ncbi:type I-E CRISPR-associated protein Cse1/CasA [Nocardia cyriacigeorgica]|uniref:type I-E CRISPR-associated protein Cse1/CasA n=1 Tax=Nocardia cyriacigeorgica TaxID=135487 RepID=UPI002455FEEC|nr:type I-E CRISPR-associated protein Cse1/CasA [Nocardia cyriacigeorgica]
MTHNGYNLLDDPWIAVLGTDGCERELSILEVFEQSPKLNTISGEVPTQAFAITRLLLAVLHRALEGPAHSGDWKQLWVAGSLPMDRIRDYADRVRPRFDLFDPARPFFQVADLRTSKGEVSSLEKIVADVPNGEPLFATRSMNNLRRIDASEAARWLVHAHAFDPSGIKSGAVGDPTVKKGKGYPIGTGWSGQIGGVLPHGANLRETLLLNLIGNEDNMYVTLGGDEDFPPWEREPDTAQWVERGPRGAIDLYTWQTRRVRLIGDRTGVTGVVLANGDKIQPQNRHGLDPHTCWRYSEPQTKKLKTTVYMPLTHDPERTVWRGLAAMLPAGAWKWQSKSRRPPERRAPAVLQWIADLCSDGVLPDSYQAHIRVVGAEYGSQSATFAEIIDDALPVKVVLLRTDHPAAGQTAINAVADAEECARIVWALAEDLVQAGGAGPDSGAGDRARERVYAVLDAPYRAWLAALGPESDLDEVRSAWQRIARKAIRPIIDELLAAAPPSAWRGRDVRGRHVNVPLADAWASGALFKALPLSFERSTDTVEESSKEVSA